MADLSKLFAITDLTTKDFEPREKTTDEVIAELKEQNEILTECILELSELLFN